jgi:predicted ATPase
MSGPIDDADARPAPVIRTPDQRLRVFISSTLNELADERRAVREAVERLRLTPVMFETGARPHPPRALYRAYLDQSDVFLGIYWKSYGWVAPDETVSGLEDEYLLSGDRPKLIYVKSDRQRQPRLAGLLDRIREDDRAAYKSFTDADELAELVADDIAVLLTERFSQVGGRPAATGLRPRALPVAVTPIVGREGELEAARSLLQDPSVRLVTLIGPGGIGKTRLALEVAAIADRDAAVGLDGVWFVDLTPVHDPARVPEVVAAALGVRAEGSSPVHDLLVDRLQDRAVLLVLDNFEQVLPAAPVVGRLLAACRGLRILVTSRAVLHLRGEREITLAPLLPPDTAASGSVEAVRASSAVQLFTSRGRQVRPGFTVTSANAQAVAALCRRLDGIPLALELAAAQLRILSPAELLERLTERLDRTLDLDAGVTDLPDRQRTLRSTVEWSHSLLHEPERAVLARLSVFAQSWTLEAAEAVAADDEDVEVFEVLSSLVSHSLVTVDESDPDHLRFRMLGMVQAFAQEQLAARREREATLDRLTHHLLRFAADAGAGLQGPDNRRWGARVDNVLEDLLAATQRAIDDDRAATVIGLSAPLHTYWWSRGQLRTMRSYAEQAAALPSADRLPPEAAALLRWARGLFLVFHGDTSAAEPLILDLLHDAEQLGDPRLRAFGLIGLGLTRIVPAAAEAVPLLDEAAAAFRTLEEPWALAFVLSARGQLALQMGDLDLALRSHTEGLAAAQSIEDEHLQAQLLDLLGLDALAAGEPDTARARFTAAAGLHRRLLDQEGSAYCLDGFAALALAAGRPEVAAQLLGASRHARDVVGVVVWPGVWAAHEALREAVAGAVGQEMFDRLAATGSRMATDEALELAVRTACLPSPGLTPSGLTPGAPSPGGSA